MNRFNSPRAPMTLRLVVCGVMCLAMLGVDRSPAARSASQLSLSTQALARYSSSRSLSDLGAAVDSLDGTLDIDQLNPDNFGPTRRALVQGYANVLKQIEGAYDPLFDGTDPKNIPYLCAPAPPSATGSGCVPPESVSDPVQRAAYIQAIKANDLKRSKMQHFMAVRQLDDVAMSGLAVTLKFLNSIAPANAGPDFAALDAIVGSAGISTARRTKIDTMIYAGVKRQ